MAEPAQKKPELRPLPKTFGELTVARVKISQPGLVRIRKGDTHGGGATELVPGPDLAIEEWPDGSVVFSGSRVIRLPPHRILEVEYAPALAVVKK